MSNVPGPSAPTVIRETEPVRSLHLSLGGWEGLDQHGELTETVPFPWPVGHSTTQFQAADRDRFPLKVRRPERLSERMSRGAGHLCVRSSESVGICSRSTAREAMQHLQRCQQSRRCGGYWSGRHIGQRAKVAEAKSSERSISGVKRAWPI